jgi:hypothetical protein
MMALFGQANWRIYWYEGVMEMLAEVGLLRKSTGDILEEERKNVLD